MNKERIEEEVNEGNIQIGYETSEVVTHIQAVINQNGNDKTGNINVISESAMQEELS